MELFAGRGAVRRRRCLRACALVAAIAAALANFSVHFSNLATFATVGWHLQAPAHPSKAVVDATSTDFDALTDGAAWLPHHARHRAKSMLTGNGNGKRLSLNRRHYSRHASKRTALAAGPLFYGLFVVPNSMLLFALMLVYAGGRTDIADGDAMQAKWATYANKPASRAAALMAGLVRFSGIYLRAKLARNKEKKHELLVRAGKRAVRELVQLGPTYVKIGQIISSRPDTVPDEIVAELKRLQDDVPAFGAKRAKTIIESEFKKPISELFKEFDEKPLAAASLGQVHRAVTLDGRQVAVKVQRDKLKEMYDLDLPQFDKVTDMMEKFKIGVNAKEMFKDAKVILYREIDYTSEADNTRKLAEAFKDEKWIKIPGVIDELTSEKILTMEYVPGIKIDNIAKIDAAPGIDRNRLGSNLAKAYLLQFCKYGVFNTDPHPGNLAVDDAVPGGRLIMYDFGQVSYLTESQTDGILQAIQSIVDLDAPACVQAFKKLGAVKEGADTKALEAKIADNFRTGKVKSRRSKQKTDYKADEDAGPPKDSEVMKSFQLPSQLAFVARAITQMRGVGVMLDEDWEFIDLVADKVPELQMEKGAGLGYLAGQFFKQFGR